MTQDFNTIRTTEDVITALNLLYFNLNEIERNFYDLFLNPNPMTINLQRYDDQGVLTSVPVKNLASAQYSAKTGSGSPEGKEIATVGEFYVDLVTHNLYYKSAGSDSSGWSLIWSATNSTQFLTVDGDGQYLTNLNMSSAGVGVLSVERGGTGRGTGDDNSCIVGIVKGNGQSPMTSAIDGLDYLGPTSAVGVICYYPVATIPIGWLMCDGSAVSRVTYARLFNIIGDTYGAGDGSTTFNLPNLMDDGNGKSYYVRSWDGSTAFNTAQQDQVGVHSHPLSGNVGNESAHTHGAGTLDHVHSVPVTKSSTGADAGSLYPLRWNDGDWTWRDVAAPDTEGAKNWSGVTSGGSSHTHSLAGLSTSNNVPASGTETRVLSKMLVPIIKY